MFTATLNRTLTSYVKAIVGAEYILRWLPIGTHEWDKFLTPQELESIAKSIKCNILKDINLFDVYTGDKLSKDKKSYSLSFIFEDNSILKSFKVFENTKCSICSSFSSYYGIALFFIKNCCI